MFTNISANHTCVSYCKFSLNLISGILWLTLIITALFSPSRSNTPPLPPPPRRLSGKALRGR